MQTVELLGISIVFFIAYLYLPTAVFRYAAETYIDLGRQADSSDIDEFVTAAIPAPVFHLLTVGILGGMHLVWAWFGSHASHLPVPDWRLMAALVTGDQKDYIVKHLGEAAAATGCYLFAVMTVSAVTGTMYGITCVDHVRGEKFRQREPQFGPVREGSPIGTSLLRWLALALVRLLWLLREFAYFVNYSFSNIIFREKVVPLFRWSVQKPAVVIRTTSGRIYFGYFRRYEKKRSGDIESITITAPYRYCDDKTDKEIAAGRLPFSDFDGSLTLLWNEITDIHESDVTHWSNLVNRYNGERITYLAGRILETCRGEELTESGIRARAIGAAKFTAEHFAQALDYLEERELVKRFVTASGVVYVVAETRRKQPVWNPEVIRKLSTGAPPPSATP